ncbi:hypothetical protein JTE90_014198 [Oedothorax gibbosus]|uniref:Uncharacterized protein n=1 Tax=Oedothorax gibbosus TaxID=931172 RepID=A0AAV6U3T5_9ARAC|nr:hypothetical protein JTE90_014198 [Oedothorax gibbosus]
MVKRISIDRLKPCFTLHENSEQSKTDASSTAAMDPPPTPCPNKSDELLPKGEKKFKRTAGVGKGLKSSQKNLLELLTSPFSWGGGGGGVKAK